MRKYRVRGWVRVVTAAAALVSGGCTRLLPPYGNQWRSHPAVLVGEWVDVQKVSASDSSVWVLGADGRDDLLRVRADGTALSRTHYGYWYATGDSGALSLCVTRRPGRDPVTCTTLAADVDSTISPPRRRLTLRRYRGEHSLGQRVLVERR